MFAPDVDHTDIKNKYVKMQKIVDLYNFEYTLSTKNNAAWVYYGITIRNNIDVIPINFGICIYQYGHEHEHGQNYSFYVSIDKWGDCVDRNCFIEPININCEKYCKYFSFNCFDEHVENHIETAMHVILQAFKSGINYDHFA